MKLVWIMQFKIEIKLSVVVVKMDRRSSNALFSTVHNFEALKLSLPFNRNVRKDRHQIIM